MKILALSDTQIGGGLGLTENRLADQERMLAEIVALVEAAQVDVVLHCGDVFHSRHPSEEARLVFKRFARSVRDYARRLVIVAGNHDLRNAELPSAVDLYDDCEFYRRPAVIGEGLAVLPWAPPHRLVAARNGGSRETLNSDVADLLVGAATDLREEMPEGPMILALHWSISGAHLPTGIPVDDLPEPVIPLADLAALGFDAIVAGHIHAAGIFHEQPPVLYCGSPWVNDWGETGQEHGVWLLNTESGGPVFVPVEDRPFVTLDVTPGDVEAGVPWAGMWAGSIERAVVRVRYTVTPEQARHVDHAQIREALLTAGASRVAAIQPTIVREDRARVAGVDENLDATAAMEAWLVSQGIDEARAAELRERGARYLEEARA